MFLKIFKTNKATNLPFKRTDAPDSPFKSYGDDEIARLEPTTPVSLNEFEFLISLGYGNALNEAILKAIAQHGLITSRQITIELNKTEKFKTVDQATVHRALQKLTRKNFVKKAHFYKNEESLKKSNFAVYSLAVWGRKILSDINCLPRQTLYYIKSPAYKQKYVLATNQVIQTLDIFEETKYHPILGRGSTAIRFAAITHFRRNPFIIECVRSASDVYKYLPSRIRRFENIIKNYKKFGFNKTPRLIVIAENPEHANKVKHYFNRIAKLTNVYFTFDTVQSADEVIMQNGQTILA